MKSKIIFIILLIILFCFIKNVDEYFTNIYIVDPNKDLYQRFLDYFHYGVKYINLPHLDFPPIHYPQYTFHNPHRLKYPYYNPYYNSPKYVLI